MNNRAKSLNNLVSVEAWRETFRNNKKKSPVHVDVTFKANLPVGGESESPVTFRLSIKRCELVLTLRETEPGAIETDSVSRDGYQKRSKQKQTLTNQSSFTAKLSKAISFGAKKAVKRAISSTTKSPAMRVTHSHKGSGVHSWEIEAHSSDFLDGKPWNTSGNSRLTLIDKRPKQTKSQPPSMTVSIICRREDLAIDEIEPKSNGEKIRSSRAKLAAAEAFILERLENSNLDAPGSLSHKFTEMTLLDLLVEEKES